jgi:hypothetical protein
VFTPGTDGPHCGFEAAAPSGAEYDSTTRRKVLTSRSRRFQLWCCRQPILPSEAPYRLCIARDTQVTLHYAFEVEIRDGGVVRLFGFVTAEGGALAAPPPRPSGGGDGAEAYRADLDRADDAWNGIGGAAERMSQPDVIVGSTIGVVRRPQVTGVPGGARRIAEVRVLRCEAGPAGFGPGDPRLLPCLDERVGFADASTKDSEHGSYRNKRTQR